MMSAPSRWGSFWMLHVLNSLALILYSCDVMLGNCSVKKLFAKDDNPTGVPSSLNPVVSSTPMFG